MATKEITLWEAIKIRIAKNKSTTFTGIMLMITALILVYFDKIEWGEFIAFLPTCLGLLYVKDTILTPTTDVS